MHANLALSQKGTRRLGRVVVVPVVAFVIVDETLSGGNTLGAPALHGLYSFA